MKIFLKIIAIAVITFIFIVHPVVKQNLPLSAKEVESAKKQNYILQVALPFKARITFQNGTSTLGKMTNIDAVSKKITLDQKQYHIAEIKAVTFAEESKLWLIHSGRITIRGDETSSNQPIILTEPLGNIIMKDANRGVVDINVTSIQPSECERIKQVAEAKTYVVDRMVFDSSISKATVIATPYSEQ